MAASAKSSSSVRTALRPLRGLLKQTLRRLGWDLVRAASQPSQSWLGLRRLPIHSVVDVGANLGQFARRALDAFPQAHIHSIEPLPEAFAALSRWAGTTGGRVSVFNLAIGDSSGGEVEMFHHIAHSASSSLLRTTALTEAYFPQTGAQSTIRVPLRTLDDTLAGLELPDDVLVKLDVQGFEDRVIRGGKKTLARARACIVEVDLDVLYHEQATFSSIERELSELGLRYGGALEQTYAADGHVMYSDVVFLR